MLAIPWNLSLSFFHLTFFIGPLTYEAPFSGFLVELFGLSMAFAQLVLASRVSPPLVGATEATRPSGGFVAQFLDEHSNQNGNNN